MILPLAVWCSIALNVPAQTPVGLAVEDAKLGSASKYGLERLTSALGKFEIALDEKGTDANRRLVIGTYGGSEKIAALVDGGTIALPKVREALAVARRKEEQQTNLYVVGYDDAGLMYALLDIADKIENAGAATDWFDGVEEISERPRNEMRRMRVMMHHAANEKDWYHSTEYWDWYLGMLAAHRFNGLNLVYSHQSPYMAPMYAWHVKLDEFPDVKPIGVSEEELARNREVMRLISRLCHERGIELTIGVWQHLPWVNAYLGSRPDQERLIEGLDADNIGPYTYKAVQKLLTECPGIARIQLRPNDESGIHPKFQTEFYRDYVVKAIKDLGTGVKVDLRTVGVQRPTIEAVREADLEMRNSFKFYGEMLGQPYTPREELTSGYSFGQYLKKPIPNPMYNEVWVIGSHRVLLWGSEDYGRRFGRNASYGGTIGYETDSPHGQMGYMEPSGPGWRIFKNPDDEYFTHEIERYWAFFRTTGRFSYNPDAPREVWLRPFRKRFGDAAEPMADAYEAASRVIGLIVSSHLENPNFYTWPEISMGGLVSYYNEIKGMDKGLFPSIDDAVEDELAGRVSGRLGPGGLAKLYESVADRVDRHLDDAAAKIGTPTKEFGATVKDFRILTHLARYHAHRQREGYNMAKFYRTHDASLLPEALGESNRAVAAWEALLEIANPFYYERLQTGQIENGHWKDKKFLVETNPKIVQEAIDTLRTHGLFDWGFDFDRTAGNRPVKVFSAHQYYNDYFHERRFSGIGPERLYSPREGYGFLENADLKATAHPMEAGNNLAGADPNPDWGLPLDLLGGDFIHSGKPISFRTDLPMDDYRMTFVFADRSANPVDHGPFDLRDGAGEGGRLFFGDIAVPAGKTVYRQVDRHIRRYGWDPFFIFSLVPSKDRDAVIAGMTIHRQSPRIAHAPKLRIPPDEPATISCTITMPPRPVGGESPDREELSAAPSDRLADATLYFRTDAEAGYRAVPLGSEDGFVFGATLDPAQLQGRWLEYYFVATDKQGRNAQLPDAAGTKTFRARLTSDSSPPVIAHSPIVECEPGKPVTIEVKATDPDGVAVVRVHYRHMDATVPYECLTLNKVGDTYVGTIPGDAIPQKDWDFMYYLEAVDEAGTGCYAPDWEKDIAYYLVKVKN